MFKSGLIYGLSTLFKLISGLVIIKLMAWALTPEQFGVLGQLMTAIGIVSMFAGGGITNGVIKMLASSNSEVDIKKTINAALVILVFSCGIISIILIIFSKNLSNFIFGNPNEGGVFSFLAITQIFVGLSNLILAMFSSRGHAWIFARISIYGTLAGLIAFVVMIYIGRFPGATYGLVMLPAVSGIFCLWAIRGGKLFNFPDIFIFPDRQFIRKLLSYSAVMVVAVSAFPLAQMASRNYMGARVGWAEVGYWQGVLKISDVYMQFIGVVLINYALPKFAKYDTPASALPELKRVMLPLLGITSMMLVIIYIIKSIIIKLIFNEKFIPMQDYFWPQLMGDLFRTAASTITYLFLAHNHKLLPIIFEIYQGLAFFGCTVLIYPLASKMAPVYSHLFTFSSLAIITGCCLLYHIKNRPSGLIRE